VQARLVVPLLAVAVAIAFPAAAAAAPTGQAASPLSTATAAADWGGRYTTPTGETISLFVSESYPVEQGFVDRWLAYLSSLAHGPELSELTLYLRTPGEVRRRCGAEALACYSPVAKQIFTPAVDPGTRISAESILAHEYGHHVASNRNNDPWEAVEYGTKRWATHEGVCAESRAGRMSPGSQNPISYRTNPGEGFAEAYRVLNERKLGRAESEWQIVSRIFYPDDTALALLEQDIASPWTASTSSALTGSFTRRAVKARTHGLATPLDGRLEVTLRVPASARLRVELLAANGRTITKTTASGTTRTLRAEVCGSRTHSLRVTRLSGAGTYRLAISKP